MNAIYSSLQQIEIMKFYECKPDDVSVDFLDTGSAIAFLRELVSDSMSMLTLRDALEEYYQAAEISRLTDHEVIQQIAREIVYGRFKLVTRETEARHIVSSGMPPEDEEAEESAEAAIPAAEDIVITNVRWSQQEARRGDSLTLSADVTGAPDGTSASVEIWEHDADGKHDFVARFSTKVSGGQVEVNWDFEYKDDTDDIPTAEDSEKGYNPPEYFFRVRVRNVSERSELLEFKDWIEIEFVDIDGIPVANEDYILHLPDGQQKQGTLDENGYSREEDIPPGPCKVEFPNYG